MKVQYQIMELDESHLAKIERDFSKVDRVCFIPAKLDNSCSNICDSFEDVVNLIQKYGNDYTEYTIIPRIYMTR